MKYTMSLKRKIRNEGKGIMKLYVWLIKTLFGHDIKCDLCGKVYKTERGKNIHRASHKIYHYDPLEGYNVKQFLSKVTEK